MREGTKSSCYYYSFYIVKWCLLSVFSVQVLSEVLKTYLDYCLFWVSYVNYWEYDFHFHSLVWKTHLICPFNTVLFKECTWIKYLTKIKYTISIILIFKNNKIFLLPPITPSPKKTEKEKQNPTPFPKKNNQIFFLKKFRYYLFLKKILPQSFNHPLTILLGFVWKVSW